MRAGKKRDLCLASASGPREFGTRIWPSRKGADQWILHIAATVSFYRWPCCCGSFSLRSPQRATDRDLGAP